jgi:hypothetical protein
MSNGTNAPQGLQPFSHYNGATWNEQTQDYRILDQYATSLFKGDPVNLVAASGTIIRYVNNSTLPLLGVFWGCEYYDANGEYIYSPDWVGGTAIGAKGLFAGARYAKAIIITDLSVVYTIQVTAGTTRVIVANVGQNSDLVMTAGNTQTGMSKVSLSQADIGAVATDPVKIVDVSPYPNIGVANFNNALVMINHSIFRDGTAGVA